MGITPSDNKWGNIAAGFVDGLIGYPVVHKVSNYIKPGSVSNCGPGYKYANVAGNIAGFVSPGGPALKGTALAVGIGIKAATKTKKVRNFAQQGLTTAQARQNVLNAAQKAPQNGSSFIYLRTDPLTSEIYVGKSKSAKSFERRQKAHNRNLQKAHNDPSLEYRFDPIAKPNGYNETKRTEEFLIRAGGGPKTTENPHAVLQNKIYASSDDKYQALGGDFV